MGDGMKVYWVVLPRAALLDKLSDKLENTIIQGTLLSEVQQQWTPDYGHTIIVYDLDGLLGIYVQFAYI